MARQAALGGNRLSLAEKARSWRTRFIRSAESSRSWMVKVGSSPIRGAYSRSSRAPMAWKVPAHVNAPGSPPARAPGAAPLPPAPLVAAPGAPPRHLDGGAPRKRHQENAAGIDAARGEMH